VDFVHYLPDPEYHVRDILIQKKGASGAFHTRRIVRIECKVHCMG